MPLPDPSLWQQFIAGVMGSWTQLYAAGLAMVIALVRSIHAGGKAMKSILEAVLCGCLTLALVPILNYLGLPPDLAVAAGAAIAFLGVEWLREKIELLYENTIEKLIKRWFK